MNGNLTPLLLGAAFITIGTLHLTPVLSEDIHRLLVDSFYELFKVNPFVEYGWWKYDALTTLNLTGVIQIICGAMVLLAPVSMVRLSYVILAFMMLTSFYCHNALHHSVRQIAPSGCFLFIILYQLIDDSYKKVKME